MTPIPWEKIVGALGARATPWRLYAVIGAAGLVLAVLGWQQWRIADLRGEMAAERTKAAAVAQQHAKDQEEAGARLIAAHLEARKKEQDWQRRADAARSTYERNLREAVDRERRVAAGGLRVRADAFAAGPGGVPEDTLDACRSRAAALGRLLGEADALAAEFAIAADRHADEVRVLLAACPRNPGE